MKVRSKEHSQDGLTLIELVVAMAVFALIAILGLQSLTGSLHLRDRLVDMADRSEALAKGTALVRHDVQSIIPMLFFAPSPGLPHSALEEIGQGLGFSISIGTERGTTAPFGRVIWKIDKENETLTRQSWQTLFPVSATQITPEVIAWEGVTALRLRSFWSETGWTEGLTPPGNIKASRQSNFDEDGGAVLLESYSDLLPLALEITVVTRAFGEIRILEAL